MGRFVLGAYLTDQCCSGGHDQSIVRTGLTVFSKIPEIVAFGTKQETERNHKPTVPKHVSNFSLENILAVEYKNL